MTHYKQLCAELYGIFEKYDDESNLAGIYWDMEKAGNDVLDRARTALAEPDTFRTMTNNKPDLCWWQKAARSKLEGKAQAIFDAYCTLADLRNRSVSQSEMLAAALRETINQCQDGQGLISAPELLRIAAQLDVAEDDIDLFQAQ